MVSEAYAAVVEEWQTTAGRVLDLAAAAVRADVDDIDNLSVVDHAPYPGPEDPNVIGSEIVDAEIDRLISDSERVVEAAIDEDGPGRAMSTLVGTITVSAALLAAAEPPDAATMSFGVDADGAVSVAGPKLLLEDLKRTLFGDPPPGVVLPNELNEHIRKLQTTGTDELVAVTREAVLWEAFSGVVSTAQTLDSSGKLKEAVEGIKTGFHWLKRAALKLVAWTLDKFRTLVPDRFKEKFDEKLEELKSALQDEAQEALPNVIGAMFGRLEAEDAWANAISNKVPLDEATKSVPNCTLKHLDRIGQASSFREGALKVAGVLKAAALLPALAVVAPYLSAAIVMVAVSVVGFVGYQMYDGFNDIEALVPAS